MSNAVTNTSRNGGRNAAPTRPDPTRPISIGCGLSFVSKELAKTKYLYVAHEARQLGFGAAR